MVFERAAIDGVMLIIPKRFGDLRGYFVETFRADLFESEIGPFTFVQDNRSFSARVGTVRGLHYQLRPRAQGKLVSCPEGALLDVAVDIRAGSSTYGRSVMIELSAENACQLWVPPGFAHGFCTLRPDTVISYKVTDFRSPEHERGLAWDDPALGIDWPIRSEDAILSEKDRTHPKLTDIESNFVYVADDDRASVA
ncbi:dTDP-4-dehydrorhamnose 3,5-epimerase [Neorhizobium alkalisoli]|uniref:dTDP-4-dehydrorhamnose 3,5-epimerase n=1 Tax=Neorhizobium alkalisoli TaxID=528178 RepID=UPI000CF84756|nr:dTDP-4-dehydrorhamnose 3,5-epimerase [Neorhizobium alkalisoli]